MMKTRSSLFIASSLALCLDLSYSMIITSSRGEVSSVGHIKRGSPVAALLFIARDITKSGFFHTIVRGCALNMSLAPITSSSSSSSSPSHLGTDLSLSTDYPTNFENVTIGADLPVPTESSANLGYLTTAAISWLILNWIIALCLVHAENRKKGRKVARNEALELPAGDMPAELKEDGLHELDIALPELNEDTFHEMFVPPVELSGDMWPELQGRPSSVSCCDPSVN